MSSEKAFNLGRANAQKITDCKAGERCSGLQASLYGHTGHVVVLPADDMQAFNRFTGEIAAGLAPETAIERQLAHFYAGCQWRINRAAALEDTLFSVGVMEGISEKIEGLDTKIQTAVSHAMTLRSLAQVFEKISGYSQSLLHQSGEALDQLKQLQADRKKQTMENLTDAARLYLFHRMQDRAFDPKASGFDLTIGQIEDHIRRDHLKNEALEAQKVDFDAARCASKAGTAAG